MAAQYHPCTAKFYRFLHSKMFLYILKQFSYIHNVKFCYHCTCQHARLLSRVLLIQNIALYKPPSNKSRTWTEAPLKSWKIAHQPRFLFMTSRYTAWCSEIGSLASLDAPELHASVTSENQFHCTRLYKHKCLYNQKQLADSYLKLSHRS